MKQELIIPESEYNKLLSSIDEVWNTAKTKAAIAVNTQLLDANWQTGRYIVEFEQCGNIRAEYGSKLLLRLSRDLTLSHGKGFSRSNLTYMRKLYLAFPKCETMSHILTLMDYALGGITDQLFVARYQLYLPKKEELQAQLDKILNEIPEE